MANYERGPLVFDTSDEGRKLAHQHEVLMSFEPVVAEMVGKMAQNPATAWQVSDLLPEFGINSSLSQRDQMEQVIYLQKSAETLSDEFLIIEAGNGTTEGGSKSFARALERISVTQTDEGIPQNGFELWGHMWDGEEDRHNYGLDRWSYLSGRIDQKAYDRVKQYYLIEGFKLGRSSYHGVQYPGFQEPATERSHRNTGELAHRQGDDILAKLLWKIRGDEARHAEFYGKLGDLTVQADPEGFVTSFAELMRDGITMPAALMHDGETLYNVSSNGEKITKRDRSDLFDNYAAVTNALGIYTLSDYYNIAARLIQRWGILDLKLGEHTEASNAQHYLGETFTIEKGLERDSRMLGILMKRYADKPVEFPWLPGKPIKIDKIKRIDFS